MRGLSPISVLNFKTFYHTVLGAAIDSSGRRRRKLRRKGKSQWVNTQLCYLSHYPYQLFSVCASRCQYMHSVAVIRLIDLTMLLVGCMCSHCLYAKFCKKLFFCGTHKNIPNSKAAVYGYSMLLYTPLYYSCSCVVCSHPLNLSVKLQL